MDQIQALSLLALDSFEQGVMMVDSDLQVLYFNEWVQEECGLEPLIEPQRFIELFPAMVAGRVYRSLQQCIDFGVSKRLASRWIDVPLSVQFTELPETAHNQSISIYPLTQGKTHFALLVINDMSHAHYRENELRSQAVHLERLANFDPLTGLMNRRYFTERLEGFLGRSHRDTSRFALMFLDLDRFKEVNDTYGHAAGDELLRRVSAQLKKLLRRNDVIGRLGGDEFVILIDNITREDQPAMVANKLLTLFRNTWNILGQEVQVGVSIGIALYPEDSQSAHGLLKQADLAMYSAKQLGRGRFQYYSSSMGEAVHNRTLLEEELNQALELGEFELYFQPQVDIHSCQIHGCEALIRWNHSSRGVVLPMEFIPVAEESMLIVALGRWVIEQSIQFQAKMEAAGMDNFSMAINLSPKQFEALSLYNILSKAIEDNQVNPSRIVLEITEGHLIQSKKKSTQTMKQLKQLGIKIALDDFGTGYSSLAYLKTLPLDYLKIDRLFVKDLVEDQVDQQIITSVVDLAQALSLQIVAEGAETPEQVSKLRELGCGVIQGFYYAQPMTSEDVLEYCLQFSG